MKKGYITLLVIVTICVLIFGIISNINKNNDEEKNEISVVTNYSEFYTVDNCINRFVTALSSKDTDSLLKQLTSSYKKENNIDENSVITVLGNIEATSFNTEAMYYETENDNVNKYYVKGTLIKEALDANMNINKQELKTYYLIVYLDNKKDTFSVEPYDGKIFIEGDIDGK